MVMNKLVLTGLTHPGAFELEPGFNTLGRNPTNDFRVHDVTVSSFHCEIVVSEDCVLVRDLGSTNGTYIDGQPVQEAQLTSGRILRLGSAELRLESLPVTEPASGEHLAHFLGFLADALESGHRARAIIRALPCTTWSSSRSKAPTAIRSSAVSPRA